MIIIIKFIIIIIFIIDVVIISISVQFILSLFIYLPEHPTETAVRNYSLIRAVRLTGLLLP